MTRVLNVCPNSIDNADEAGLHLPHYPRGRTTAAMSFGTTGKGPIASFLFSLAQPSWRSHVSSTSTISPDTLRFAQNLRPSMPSLTTSTPLALWLAILDLADRDVAIILPS